MPVFGIYTNCQGKFIQDLFLFKMPYFLNNDWEFIYMANYAMISSKETLDKEMMQSFDIFLYQPVNTCHGIYSTLNEDGILGMLKPECLRISFPSLYMDAWPIYEENGKWLGADCIFKDRSIPLEKLLELYDTNMVSFNLKERFESSLDYLISREALCTIKTIGSFIREKSNHEILFHTQNHPSIKLLSFLTMDICKAIQDHFQISNIYIEPECDSSYISRYGSYNESRYMKSELGWNYISDHGNDHYRNTIINLYNNPSLIGSRYLP